MQRPASSAATYLIPLAAVLHAVLALAVVSRVYTAGDRFLQMTYREQFSNWDALLRLVEANATRDEIMAAAWCDFPRPHGNPAAPFCACVGARASALNISGAPDAPGLVGACLRKRGTWRVSHSWTIHPATGTFFVLLSTACFLAAAMERPPAKDLYAYACWGSAALSVGLLVARDPLYNALWVIAFFSAATSITFVLTPGLRGPFADRTYESCFWWAEFFVAPVFVLYTVAYNGGRDLAFALSAIMLGTLLSGAALRSLWYSVAFAEHPKIVARLQRCAWLIVVAITTAMAYLAALYHRPHPELVMPTVSLALAALTCVIALLQSPTVPRWLAVPLQSLLALARNLTLAGAVWRDTS